MESPLQPGSRGAEALKNISPGSSVSVAYHPLFGPYDDLLFLELDEKLLPDVLNERVVLRGQPDECAVLCTQSKTYAMKFVGTSNSVLLVPPENHSELYENPQQKNDSNNDEGKIVVPVVKVVSGNMELIEAAPRLDKLKSLLSEKPYKLEEDDDMGNLEENPESRIGLYNWNDLVDNIQASDGELLSGLHAISALEINGYWRLLDGSYMDMILGMILKNAVLNDWSLDALNEDEVVSTLVSDGFLGVLARHCLHVYGNKVKECMPIWKLDEKQVCIHFAREILKGGKRKLESFMDEWRQKIPDGMHPTFDLVEGELLTERIGVETWVRAFSVASLPSTPAERFSILFRERPKWQWKDLQPYIRDLKVPGLSSESLLLKYTRRTQPSPDTEPVFSAR